MVALRKESVDRNPLVVTAFPGSVVALRKESVDRNMWLRINYYLSNTSLSARRAWIEMVYY